MRKDAEAQRDFDAAFQLDSSLRPEFEDFIKKMREALKVKKKR